MYIELILMKMKFPSTIFFSIFHFEGATDFLTYIKDWSRNRNCYCIVLYCIALLNFWTKNYMVWDKELGFLCQKGRRRGGKGIVNQSS